MKRSEMISKINEYLDKQRTDSYGEMYNNDSMGEEILELIEEMGMLPPFNNVVYYNSWRDGGTGNVWEKE